MLFLLCFPLLMLEFILGLQFDEGRVDYDGEHNEAAITQFIKANQLPLVTEFNDEVNVVRFLVFNFFIQQ